MNDNEPKIELVETNPAGGRIVRVTSFESRVEVVEESWFAAATLTTNGARPIEIFHTVPASEHTDNALQIRLQPGQTLTLRVDAFDEENKKSTRIEPSIENGRIVFRAPD